MVSFINHIASILYERGLTCGAVYPLYYYCICNVDHPKYISTKLIIWLCPPMLPYRGPVIGQSGPSYTLMYKTLPDCRYWPKILNQLGQGRVIDNFIIISLPYILLNNYQNKFSLTKNNNMLFHVTEDSWIAIESERNC